jgi:hypothetical protein
LALEGLRHGSQMHRGHLLDGRVDEHDVLLSAMRGMPSASAAPGRGRRPPPVAGGPRVDGGGPGVWESPRRGEAVAASRTRWEEATHTDL